jgi:hypothetical protein
MIAVMTSLAALFMPAMIANSMPFENIEKSFKKFQRLKC